MIPNDIEKLKTSQYLRFINTTPSAQNPTWKVLGGRHSLRGPKCKTGRGAGLQVP